MLAVEVAEEAGLEVLEESNADEAIILLETVPGIRIVMSSLIMVRDAVRAVVGAARLPISLVCHDSLVGHCSTGATSKDLRSRFGHCTRRGVS
jgi:hypothetical protein